MDAGRRRLALGSSGLGSLAVEAVPGTRAGATSVYSAFRFAGLALAPVVWLPLFHADPSCRSSWRAR